LDPTKIDEYAKTDPIARRVSEHLDRMPTIRNFIYIGRLTDTLLFITDLLDVYHVARPQIVRRKMKGIPEMCEGYLKPDLPKATLDFLTRAMHAEFEKKVAQYEPWLLNQGLVMLCTIFDVFLEHVLEVLFTARIELLYAPDEARRIDLKTIVALGSVNAVVTEFRQREIRRFSFHNIDKRLRYLKSRCGIATSAIFDWSLLSREGQEQLKGWNKVAKLRDIYEDRHLVVHSNKLPLTKREELERVKEYLDKLVMNITRAAGQAQDVWSDPERLLATAELYEKFKSETTS
jgi:hypothetical protein